MVAPTQEEIQDQMPLHHEQTQEEHLRHAHLDHLDLAHRDLLDLPDQALQDHHVPQDQVFLDLQDLQDQVFPDLRAQDQVAQEVVALEADHEEEDADRL